MRALSTLTLLASTLAQPVPSSSNGTNFLNHGQLLNGVEFPEWFEANVPFLDVPNQQIQDVYYYRWQSYREHLLYTSPQYGYLSTEFLLPVGYGGPYGGIVAAAGHHINEGRWMRDRQAGKDLVNFWLAGPGTFPKLANDGLNSDTHDWAHEYSFWAASVVWRQYLATGDQDFVVGQLDNLISYYSQYDNHYNSTLGLYWQVPVWDATEYTAASYNSSDPYHGGAGFRPTINSYQYGDARAIAQIAALKGDSTTASRYNAKADALRNNTQKLLWDTTDQFFKHRARDNNPTGALLKDREIMGYVPWIFNLPDGGNYSVAFKQLLDPQGFSSPFGPTTLENRSSLFYDQAEQGCCHWDGPSWPYATAQTLTAVENLLNDYPAQNYLTASDYFTLFMRYVLTQFKNGVPYVAEAHEAYKDSWIYDSPNHSEDYNHSTFIDNLIAGLLGIRAQSSDSLILNPLVPSNWTYFALENLSYHGHLITILWDKTGTHYNKGQGLRVYIDGTFSTSHSTISKLTIPVPAPNIQAQSQLVNIVANPLSTPQGPRPLQTYTSSFDSPVHPLDGAIFRVGIPENTRWTTFQSPNTEDFFGVNLRQLQAIDNVDLYFYDDAGGVRVPQSYEVEYLPSNSSSPTMTNSTTWISVPNQSRSPSSPSPQTNGLTRITFPAIMTSALRVRAANPPPRNNGTGWGLSEVQIWSAPTFGVFNTGKNLTMAVGSDGSVSVTKPNLNKDKSQLWSFEKETGGWFKIRSVGSGGSLTLGAGMSVGVESDSGNDGQRWRMEDIGDGKMTGAATGRFVVRNKGVKGVVLSLDQGGKVVAVKTDSGTETGADGSEVWELLGASWAS